MDFEYQNMIGVIWQFLISAFEFSNVSQSNHKEDFQIIHNVANML